jgi:hypothetical protein
MFVRSVVEGPRMTPRTSGVFLGAERADSEERGGSTRRRSRRSRLAVETYRWSVLLSNPVPNTKGQSESTRRPQVDPSLSSLHASLFRDEVQDDNCEQALIHKQPAGLSS